MIPLPLAMPKIFPRIKHINLKIHNLPLRNLNINQIHWQDLPTQILKVVVCLVGTDHDVELAVGGFVDGVDGIIEEILADVELVVVVAGGFFGFCRLDAYGVHYVGRSVAHFDDLLDRVAAGCAAGNL